jgi:hypothetical protein
MYELDYSLREETLYMHPILQTFKAATILGFTVWTPPTLLMFLKNL